MKSIAAQPLSPSPDQSPRNTERMSPDERHADVVSRYPGGLTRAQFEYETLASADEDGKLDPPSIADWFTQTSLLMGMFLDGRIERRCKRDEAGPWFITSKGLGVFRVLESVSATTRPCRDKTSSDTATEAQPLP